MNSGPSAEHPPMSIGVSDHPGAEPLTRQDTLLVLALAILPFLVFYHQTLLQSFWWVLDIRQYFFAYHAVVAQMVRSGIPPLWNPYAFSGMPLLGDGQTALFYPPNWLFFLMPTEAALSYAILLQFSIAGASTYFYARVINLTRMPALIAALSFMFGGFMVSRIIHVSIMAGAALTPLLFAGFERTIVSRSRLWAVLTSVFIAIQLCAGHPQVPVYTAAALSVYTPYRALMTYGTRSVLRALLAFCGIYGLAAGLAAIQLIPWAELASSSPRAAAIPESILFSGSVRFSDTLLLLFPFLRGSLQPGVFTATLPDVETAIRIWEHGLYVGVLPLFLALFAVTGLRLSKIERHATRNSVAIFWVAAVIIALLAASAPTAGIRFLITATPVIGKLRQIARMLVLANLGIALLAGIGLQSIVETSGNPRTRRILTTLAFVAVVLPFAIASLLQWPAVRVRAAQQHTLYLELTTPNILVPLAFACVSGLLFGWWARNGITAFGMRAAVILAFADLALFASSFYPAGGPEYYAAPPVVAFLNRDKTLFRVMPFCGHTDLAGQWSSFQSSASMPYRISSANGFNSLQTRRYTDYLFSPSEPDVSYGRYSDEHALRPESPLLSSLNVKYVIVSKDEDIQPGNNLREVYHDGTVTVYENLGVYPRAWFPQRTEAAGDSFKILESVRSDGFDGRKLAFIELPGQISTLSAAPAPEISDSISWTEWSPDRLALKTMTSKPQVLVLSEIFSPGWRAFVDGQETTIYRANYIFRALKVPAGAHSVSLLYRPLSVISGLWVSILSIVAGVVIACSGLLSTRKPSPSH